MSIRLYVLILMMENACMHDCSSETASLNDILKYNIYMAHIILQNGLFGLFQN